MNYYKRKCKNPKCGKEFMGTQNQVYCCPECRPLRPHQKAKEEKKAMATQTRKKRVPTVDEIARKAKSLGMSYGKYIQMLAIEKARKEREERMNLV